MPKAIFTNDRDMARSDDLTEIDLEACVAYLEASPRHAVVVEAPDGGQIAVWRGAGEHLENFYWQEVPVESPDAEGGMLTARDALDEVLLPFDS